MGQTPGAAAQNVPALQCLLLNLFPLLQHTLTAAQVRLSYLQILGELKMYSGKIFNATMMV